MFLTEFLTDSKPLYVNRPVLNTDDIRQWAAAQGFPSMLPPDDLHVTVARSTQPLAWEHLPAERKRLIVRGGKRHVKQLGDKGAVVLCFSSHHLSDRWQFFCDAGASWDFPSYQPHLTITYNGAELSLDEVTPFAGDLIFGFEKFKEIQEDWHEKISEIPT